MRHGLLLAAVAFLTPSGRAEYPTLKARPAPLAGIPNYPYQPANPPPRPTVTGTGQSRITLGEPGALPVRVPPEVSGAAVSTTRETQTCRTVSTLCRTVRTETRERTTTTGIDRAADPVPAEVATFTLREPALTADGCRVSGVSVVLSPDGRYAVRYRADFTPAAGVGAKRQLFLLTVRGYAVDPLGETAGAATRAAVVQIPVEPVWVNRGEPYLGFAEGTSEAVRRHYKWIDRVDVDFTYR